MLNFYGRIFVSYYINCFKYVFLIFLTKLSTVLFSLDMQKSEMLKGRMRKSNKWSVIQKYIIISKLTFAFGVRASSGICLNILD